MLVTDSQIHDTTLQLLLKALETKHMVLPAYSPKAACHTELAKHLGEAYTALFTTIREFHKGLQD